MLRSSMPAGVVIAVVALVATGSQAQTVTASGSLHMAPAGASVCSGENHFLAGQSVRITGTGFSSGASIEVFFETEGAAESLIDTVSADGSGALDAVVTLPTGAASGLAALSAEGPYAGTNFLSLGGLFNFLAAPGGDSDEDSVPDACDNCPSMVNSGQEDDDLDGVGNLCDACPLDAENDADSDGVCGDVDQCPFDADNDADADQVCGDVDNCPNDANPSQLDQDGNGIGDACQMNATCSDGIDNDGDGLVDHPADPGCSDADDPAETDPTLPCDDGRDNDADALVDFVSGGMGDPGCASGASPAEDPECDDSVDNDGDGDVDWDGVYGVHTPDSDCAGDGSGVSEMPEPMVTSGLVWGAVLLSALRRRRRR